MELRYLTRYAEDTYTRQRVYQHAAENAAFHANQWLSSGRYRADNPVLAQLCALTDRLTHASAPVAENKSTVSKATSDEPTENKATEALPPPPDKSAQLTVTCLDLSAFYQPSVHSLEPNSTVQTNSLTEQTNSPTEQTGKSTHSLVDSKSLKQLVYQQDDYPDAPELWQTWNEELVQNAKEGLKQGKFFHLTAEASYQGQQVQLQRTFAFTVPTCQQVLKHAQANLQLVEYYLGSKRQRAPGHNNYDCLVQALIDEPLSQRLLQVTLANQLSNQLSSQLSNQSSDQDSNAHLDLLELAQAWHFDAINSMLPDESPLVADFWLQGRLVDKLLGNSYHTNPAGQVSFVPSAAYQQYIMHLLPKVEAKIKEHFGLQGMSLLLKLVQWREHQPIVLEKNNRHLKKLALRQEKLAEVVDFAHKLASEVATAAVAGPVLFDTAIDLWKKAEADYILSKLGFYLTAERRLVDDCQCLEDGQIANANACLKQVVASETAADLKTVDRGKFTSDALYQVSTILHAANSPASATVLFSDPVLVTDQLTLRKNLGVGLAYASADLLRVICN